MGSQRELGLGPSQGVGWVAVLRPASLPAGGGGGRHRGWPLGRSVGPADEWVFRVWMHVNGQAPLR